MSCLSVSLVNIGGISVSREKQGGGISTAALLSGTVAVNMSRQGTGKITAKRADSGLIHRFIRVGGITAATGRIGGITVKYERQGGDMSIQMERQQGITTCAEYMTGMTVGAKREGGVRCRVFMICTPSFRNPYLEISPSIVWMLAGWTSNDVFSNTNWQID